MATPAHLDVVRLPTPVWSDLEEAFFAAAPPDEPPQAAEPVRFDEDESLPPAPRRRHTPETPRRALVEARLDWRMVVVRLAAAGLLIGLGAAVFTSSLARGLPGADLSSSNPTGSPESRMPRQGSTPGEGAYPR